MRVRLLRLVLMSVLVIWAPFGDQAQSDDRQVPIQDTSLRESFSHVLSEIKTGSLGEMSIDLGTLRERGQELGYSNFPLYSLQLLDFAEQAQRNGDLNTGAFFIRQAVGLSPTDSGVLYRAAQYHQLVGRTQALTYLWDAGRNVLRVPVFFLLVMASLLLFCLVGMTVASLFFFGVQLARVLLSTFRQLDEQMAMQRKILMVGGVTVLLAFPLVCGVLWVVAAWALVLAFFWPQGEGTVRVAGAIILAWAAVLFFAPTFLSQMSDPAEQALQRILSGDFASSDAELVEQRAQHEKTGAFQLGSALVALRGKMLDSAITKLTFLSEGSGGTQDDIRVTARPYLGAALLASAKYQEAYTRLSQTLQAQGSQPELLFNLSLAGLKSLNTEEYRSAYERLQKEFPDEERKNRSAFEKQQTLIAAAPWFFRAHVLFADHSSADSKVETMALVRVLLGSPRLESLGWVLALVLLSGVCTQGFERFFPRRKRGSSALDGLPTWGWIPGWTMFEHGHKFLAVFVLGMSISCLLTAAEVPVVFRSAGSSVPGVGAILLGIIVALMVLQSGYSLRRAHRASGA